jgi:hypothetical protein
LRYVSNDEDATIDGSVNGIITNIAAAGLTAIRNDGIDNYNLVPGANDVLLLGFDLRANDVADIRVTSINLQPSVVLSGISMSEVTNVRLYQGETLLTTKNDFNFGTINVEIMKNQSKRFTIVANFATSIDAGDTIELNLNTGSTNISARNMQSNAIVNL